MWSLYRREVVRFLRWSVMALLSPAATAALYLLVFELTVATGVVGAELSVANLDFTGFVAPGLIFMSLAMWSFSGPAYAIMISKMDRCIEDELMAPLSPVELLGAHLGAAMTVGLAAGLAVALATWPFAPLRVQDPVMLAVFALATSIMMGFIGMLAALLCDKWDQMAAVSELGLTPLIMLSCVFYPLGRLHPDLADAMVWNPVFAALNGFRAAMTGYVDMPVEHGLPPLAMAITLGFVASYWVVRTGFKLKS